MNHMTSWLWSRHGIKSLYKASSNADDFILRKLLERARELQTTNDNDDLTWECIDMYSHTNDMYMFNLQLALIAENEDRFVQLKQDRDEISTEYWSRVSFLLLVNCIIRQLGIGTIVAQ
jgi:hypothetical protein